MEVDRRQSGLSPLGTATQWNLFVKSVSEWRDFHTQRERVEQPVRRDRFPGALFPRRHDNIKT